MDFYTLKIIFPFFLKINLKWINSSYEKADKIPVQVAILTGPGILQRSSNSSDISFFMIKMFLSHLPLHITEGENKIFSEHFYLFVFETVLWLSSNFHIWTAELCPIHNQIWSRLIQKEFTLKSSLGSWLENQIQAEQ